ncbi:MAG: hypothetical protein WKF84_29885, partial [Pyrinomonadaceae bacterium]
AHVLYVRLRITIASPHLFQLTAHLSRRRSYKLAAFSPTLSRPYSRGGLQHGRKLFTIRDRTQGIAGPVSWASPSPVKTSPTSIPPATRQSVQLSTAARDDYSRKSVGTGVNIDGVHSFRAVSPIAMQALETGIAGRLTAQRDARYPVEAA